MANESLEILRTGVCGFCLPQAQLFHKFQCLEVQQTLYWPPQLKTVERWRRTAPADFEFTVKAFQAITHSYNHRTYRKVRFSPEELAQCGGFGDTPVVRSAWEVTRSVAVALDSEFVVFQCPPSFAATDESVRNVRAFFSWAGRGKLRFTWEPRHATWTGELISSLCRELDLIHTVDPFEKESVWGQPRYYRLHGKSLGGYRYGYGYRYSDSELAMLKQRVGRAPAYCMFNNRQMAADAERFERSAVNAESHSVSSTQE